MVEAETELAQAIDITSAVVRGLRLLSVLTARLPAQCGMVVWLRIRMRPAANNAPRMVDRRVVSDGSHQEG